MRVKFPATVQFMRLGYEYQSLKDADIHPETRIFLNRFVPAIQRINRDKNLTVEQILATIEEIHGIIKNNDMGKEFLGRLLNQAADIKLIDFDRPADNDFAVVDELTFGPEAKGSFRPDVTVLINGIPLGFLEVKKPNNEGGIQKEFHRMLDERLQVPEFKKYFNMLQFVTFSNNMEYETDNDAAPAEEVRAGSFYSTPNGNRTFFSFFREENPKTSGFKEIYMDEVRYILKDNGYSPSYADTEEFQTNLQSSTPCNRFVTSFFDIPRMMYLLQYGFFYVDTIDEKTGQPVTQKHIMRYPQFFASQAILKRIDGGGKSGIIFHTQGSGKTELSAFSTRIIRDYYSERGITAKFYYVVDRLDLLIQVRDEMRNRGLNAIEVNSRTDFEKELKRPLPKRGDLRSNGEIVVVNIQKFTDALPQVSNVYDAKIQRIFFVDEAHRSYSGHPIIQRISGPSWVNNHAHVLEPEKTYSCRLLMMILKDIPVVQIKTGSIQWKINQENLNKYKIANIPSALRALAVSKLEPIDSMLLDLKKENEELTSLRDFLLPMLLNGQVKVKGA